MRKTILSLTHIRVYKIILRKTVSLLATTMLLANSYLPYFAYGLQPTIAHADAPPALFVTFDKSTHELELAVNTASKVEYAVSYIRTADTGYQIEGVQGSGDDVNGRYSKKIFMGTCSATDCIKHDVKRAIVKVRVQDLSWAYEHKLIFEANGDLSLVEEGKIENLDLTEADTKWLENVNVAQPSLTPTPTTAPASDTVTPTPTEIVVTPTTEVTQAVTETPTPTTQVIVPELNESVSVVLKETAVPADSSLIDSVLSTLFPFLFTDKPDYSPTEKAIISGKEFLPYSTYMITVSSSDEPAVSFTDTVTTTGTGTFEYTYQLDGTYRPNYAVEVKDGNGVVVAKTAFTDAAFICSSDISGANDVAGQKDLTYMCRYSDVSLSVQTKWNWDEISWSGNNTGDACNLFDTDNDGNANTAICVTIGGSPAVIQSYTRYTCSDHNPDKCSNPNLTAITSSTTCSVSGVTNDPFPAGASYPNDTQAYCDISLTDAGTGAKLIDVCSYPSQQPNSSPSDCINATTQQTGKLEIVKKLSPSTNSGLFDLLIDGTVRVAGIGDGGTTGEQPLITGTHNFSEAGSGSTSLNDYNISVSCKASNGTGSTVPTTNINPWSIVIANNDDVVCTITNTRKQATLTVNKVLIPSTDPGKFNLKIGGTQYATDVGNGGSTGAQTVSPGTVSFGETAGTGTDLANYTVSYSAGCENGQVTLNSSDNKTCTITNTRKTGTIIINKTAVGGNDTFGYTIAGPTNVSASLTTVSGTGTTGSNTVNTGTYTVTENTPPTGWKLTSTSANCQNPFTIGPGETVTCSFTNTKSASLTVIKTVTNDNGGSRSANNFTVNIKSNGNSIASHVGSSTGYTFTLDPGSYVVSEDNPATLGYELTGITGQCGADGSVTLSAGETKTCTLTNNDIPGTLTVKKVVINDNGGTAAASAFSFKVNNGSSQQFNSNGQNDIATDYGTLYSVVENSATGYTTTYDNCSNISLPLGGSATCTITNNDVAPTLRLVKDVTTDNGGTATSADWNLTATGDTQGFTDVGNSTTFHTVTAGVQYTLTESTGPTGYAPGSWTCTGGGVQTNNKITLSPGDVVTCSIVNDDIAPKLTVTKILSPVGHGGFDLKIDNTVLASNVGNGGSTGAQSVTVGTHTFSETNGNPSTVMSDYITTYGGEPGCNSDGTVTLKEGEEKMCTITNIAYGSLTIVKDATPNSDQDFEFTATGSGLTNFSLDDDSDPTLSNSKIFIHVTPGTYGVSENSVVGWEQTGATCSDGSPVDAIEISDGENVTCTFSNSRLPKLTVNKVVVNNNGGTATVANFQAKIDDNNIDWGVVNILNPSTYVVSETGSAGYGATYSSDCPNGTITLAYGDDKTCTITNDDEPGTLIVKKVVVNDNGGKLEAKDFSFQVNDGTVTAFEADGQNDLSVNAGTYSVTEPSVSGYATSYDHCANVVVQNGKTQTCTITNRDIPAILTVTKVVVNNQYGTKDVADFPLFVNTTSVTSGSQTEFNAGTYTVSETNTPGYEPVISGDCDPATGSVTLAVGDVKSCTITNTDTLGKIIIEKQTLPNGSLQSFAFTGDLSGNIKDGETLEEVVVPGNYAVTETALTGWDLTNLVCSDDNSGVGPTAGQVANINVKANETVTCVFTNTQRGSLSGEKYNDANGNGNKDEGDTGLSDWAIKLFDETGTTELANTTTNTNGIYSFPNIVPGNYQVCEMNQEGWTNTDPGAGLGSPVCKQVTVNIGQETVADFGNVHKGDVTVYKFNDLNGNGYHDEGEPYLPDWEITLDELTQTTTGDSSNANTIFNVVPGDYVLGENTQEGWTQSNIYCEGDELTSTPTPTPTTEASPTVTPSASPTPTSTNTPTPTIEIDKKIAVCRYNNGKKTYNAIEISENAYHPEGENGDFYYKGSYALNTTDADLWCQRNIPTPTNPSLTLLDKLLGVSTVFAREVDNFINGYPVTVTPGGSKVCYIGNYQKGKIIVKKNVVGHTGGEVQDTTVFTVTGDHGLGAQQISEGSPYTFDKLNPGVYTFTETSIPGGYTFQNVTGDEDPQTEGAQVTVTSGSETTITFINKAAKPSIFIRKFNDKWPTPQSTGTEVLYTIIVSVRDAGMNDVHVIDLPPDGFKYKSGSWKAYISHNGGPTLPYSVPQPGYASPGTWLLGNLAKDDVVTLTYLATIGGNEKPGLYKDLAWAYGCSGSTTCSIASEDRLLASSEDSTKTDPGIITDNVVGTQIEIPKVGTPDNTINILEKREVGSVLGASTQRLPSTGLSSSLTAFALFQLILGAVFGLLYFLSKRMKKVLKIGLSIMIVGSLVLLAQPRAFAIDASEVAVRVEQPKSPANEGFDLGFVVLDLYGRQLTARCYVSSPKNSWTFTQFGSDITLKAGGNSGICKVNTGDLAEGDNVYEVRVTVLGEPATPYVKQVDNVTVKYIPNSLRPGVPTNYNRQDISSCEKKITFLSANDGGKTIRVEVYRGDSTEFTLNDGTKVGTLNIGSNTSGSYTDTVPDCNKKYYYALRAFDAAGNYSDVVGDRVYETVTTTTSGGTTETVGEAGTTAGGAVLVRDSDIPAERGSGQVLGEGTDKLSGTPEATPEGNVLGEETSPTQATNFVNAVKETVTGRGAWILVGGVLLLFGILYFVYRRWTGKDVPQTK